MDYKKLEELILNASNDNTVESTFNAYEQCEEFRFTIPVRQSFCFGGYFLPTKSDFRVFVKMEYEDFLDIFNVDDDDDEDAENKYDEFLDNFEDILHGTNGNTALGRLYDWAVEINESTNYVNDDIIKLLETCANLD